MVNNKQFICRGVLTSPTSLITAHYLNSQPDLVKRMVEEGHIVGNHTPKFLNVRK